ncbi:MAG TPA: chemotaxis protein CheW [Longimicrobiales bacterium]|nr:chemotaxis protein CheW [Longimicrobiales bacterium]
MTRYLLVGAGGETWAIAADSISEVVEAPAIDTMPALPERVRGVLAHRGSWLPVLDLAGALGLGLVDGLGAALIMDRGRTTYALLVEAVLRTDERAGADAAWTSEEGVVTRLDVDELFEAPPPVDLAPVEEVDADAAGPRSVVCFRIGDAELGVSSDNVDRIWPFEEPRPVPGLPDYVVGVLTVGGYTMPILDLGKHLGLPTRAQEGRRVLVLGREDQRVGWVVDEVIAVAPIEAARWSPLPALFAGRSARLVEAVVRYRERRPLLILRPDQLLDADQRRVLQGSPSAE